METERTSERRDRPLRLILIVVASILIIPLVLMAVMMPMMWMVGGMETGGAVSMSPVWGIGMMLVFLLIVLGVGYALYRTRSLRQESAAGTRQSKNSESRMLVVNCHKKSSNSGGKRSKKRTNRIYHTDDKH